MDTPGADGGASELQWTRPGEVIAGKYRVERVLGEGGMGVVVAATHLVLGELVAVKLLRGDVTVERNEALARFSREARAAAKMRGEHVARVYDVDTLDDGTSFIVLEYLEGQDLDAWLGDSGRLPLEIAVGYILEACEGLAEAHAVGIVHRDVKPSNLFLAARPDGTARIKVLDFGISRTREIAPDSTIGPRSDVAVSSLTIGALGTPPYVAPEQIMDSTSADARADIFALGATLYELVTGRPPFAGPSLYAMCTAILRNDPAPPSSHLPELPEGFDEVLLRCLAKHPADRFANVAELARALVPFGPEDSGRIADNTDRMLHPRAREAGRASLPTLPERTPKRVHRTAIGSDPRTAPTPKEIDRERRDPHDEGEGRARDPIDRGPAGDSAPPVESQEHALARGDASRQARVRRIGLAAAFVVMALSTAVGGVALGRRFEQAPVVQLAVPRVSAVAWGAATWVAASAALSATGAPGTAVAPPSQEDGATSPAAPADAAVRPAASASAEQEPDDRGRVGRTKRARSTEEDLFHDRK